MPNSASPKEGGERFYNVLEIETSSGSSENKKIYKIQNVDNILLYYVTNT
jgi:hypothetical protein